MILNNSDCVEVKGDSSAPSSRPLPLRSSSKRKRPAAKSGAGAGSKPVDRGVGARKRAAAKTLGGNIINCWAKATGKPVRWPTPYILLYCLYCCTCGAYCCVLLCVHTSYYVQYTNCTVPSLPIIPLTRFAVALLNFLGSQHRIVPFKVLLCGGLCFCIRCTTVVLPALGVLCVFCFRCSIKQQQCCTACFLRLNLLFSSIYFVLNFELVVIYRGLLHCCTLVYTYVQQYVQQY